MSRMEATAVISRHTPAAPSLRGRFDRVVAVAGRRVAVVLERIAEPEIGSHAARLAERLVAHRLNAPPAAIRVAALMPSGRPLALAHGREAPIFVSLAHACQLAGAAACAEARVGLDIVDPADAGRGLDIWFTPDELALDPDDDGLLRARLWAAKEAAYKAAGIDDGFRPGRIAIDDLGRSGFRWAVRSDRGSIHGAGSFLLERMHLVAIAVAEAAGCS